MHCVPIIITSSMFIGFESRSNDWKDEKVSYEFVLEVFRYCAWTGLKS
jgi:hypothetical protein